jgi:hypothetical protein
VAYYKLTVTRNCQGLTLYAVKKGGWGQMTRIGDQVRLERHRCLLKGLYTGKGLDLKLGTKGETVNEAKYSTGSRKEA